MNMYIFTGHVILFLNIFMISPFALLVLWFSIGLLWSAWFAASKASPTARS